jgi:hypothetical protein
MVLRVAIMDGETVANVALWDGEATWHVPGARIIAEGLSVGPGWRWTDDGWAEPEAVEE